jgi:hypothetical protein
MTPGTIDSIEKPNTPKVDGQEKERSWPEVLVVTGLEDCDSPLQMKLIDLVKLSKHERGEEMLVIWVRDEGKSDVVPAWLVSPLTATECDLTGRPIILYCPILFCWKILIRHQTFHVRF